MSKDIKDFLNDESLQTLSEEIVEKLTNFQSWNDVKTEKEKETIGRLDFNYNLKEGVMAESSDQPNTYFSFDFDENSLCYEFMKAMYARDMEEAEERQIGAFMQLLAEKIVDDYTDSIKETIRTAILQGASEEAVPLNLIKILSLEIVDYTSAEDKYLTKFVKMPDVPINMQKLQSRVLEIRDENPTKSLRDIVLEERDAGNPVFQGILDVEQAEKYLWDINITMHVDYSFSQRFLEVAQNSE